MSKTIICFYPTHQKRSNHFLFNLAKLLESSGAFECWGYKDLQKERPRDLFKADIYHINWFDQSVSFVSFLKRLCFLLTLNWKKKKIVWTVHNLVPHSKSPWYNAILRWLLLRFSAKIHIMSRATAELSYLRKYKDKVIFIPHGDYFCSYPKSDLNVRARYGIEGSKNIILFLGAVQPYKNVDVLISAYKKAFPTFKAPVLLICGKVEPESYGDELVEISKGMENVILDMKFVRDEDLSAYISSAEILVAPYSYRSSLNSGTILLAFSYGKTVICPDIACVKDIQEETDCLYSYHYESAEEHILRLSEIFKQINAAPEQNEMLKRKSQLALEYMKKHSWESHRKEWLSLYGVSK